MAPWSQLVVLLWGTTALSVTAQHFSQTPHDWALLNEDIHDCLLSASFCVNTHSRQVVQGAITPAKCASVPLGEWVQTYDNATQLQLAVQDLQRSQDQHANLYLVQLTSAKHLSSSEQRRWEQELGVRFEDFVRCGDRGFVYMHATSDVAERAIQTRSALSPQRSPQQDPNSSPQQEQTPTSHDFAFRAIVPLPPALKLSPTVDDISSMNDMSAPGDEDRLHDLHVHFGMDLGGDLHHTHAIAAALHKDLHQGGCLHHHVQHHHVYAFKSEYHARELGDFSLVNPLMPHHGEHDRFNRTMHTSVEAPRQAVFRGIKTSHLDKAHAMLTAHRHVKWVERRYPVFTQNLDAAGITQSGVNVIDGASPQGFTPLWDAGLSGDGQVVGVGDSGLDIRSCFFTDSRQKEVAREPQKRYDFGSHRKVAQYVSFIDGTASSGGSDHGTHVSGIVAGRSTSDSLASNVKAAQMKPSDFNGMAPGARVTMFDMGVDGSPAILSPNDLSIMFDSAYQVGARIHTNSWGGRANAYTSDCESVDSYTFGHQDVLVLFAAGNFGNVGQTATVGSPGVSKNALSVGATKNSDRSFKLIGKDCENGGGNCPNNIPYFSSMGPTFDDRIKPDIVAPGDLVASAASGSVCDVTWLQGTSMATPVVAGNAAMVREYFAKGYYPAGVKNIYAGFQPMGSLLKAMMITGATTVTGNHVDQPLTTDGTTAQMYQQGHGRLQLNTLLKLDTIPNDSSRLFVMGDASKPLQLNQGDEAHVFTFNTDGGASQIPFKVTLVWSDPPAALGAKVSLVNDLDLQVRDLATGILYPVNGAQEPDSKNNVEAVVISQGLPSVVEVRVAATSVTQGPQPYSIVVHGAFQDGSAQLAGEMVPLYEDFPPPPAEMSLTLPIVIGVGAIASVGLVGGMVVMRRRSSAPANARGMQAAAQPDQMAMYAMKQQAAARQPAMQYPQQYAQQQQPQMMAQQANPWTAAIDAGTGRQYFYNQMTGERRWANPMW